MDSRTSRSRSWLPARNRAPTGRSSISSGSTISRRSDGVAEDDRGRSGRDYQISADDNVIIDNAAGTRARTRLRRVRVRRERRRHDQGVRGRRRRGLRRSEPRDGDRRQYPLGRSLYIYVNPTKLAENPALQPFVDFYLTDEGIASVEEVEYIALPDDRLAGDPGRVGVGDGVTARRDTDVRGLGRDPEPRLGRER